MDMRPPRSEESERASVHRLVVRALALTQGLFYLATGIWPLISIRTFELVTGPKTDRWLVKTAGVVITAIGAALLVAGQRREVTPPIQLLAVGSAAGLTSIDLIYVARRRISRVYLLDALAELLLIGGWASAWIGERHQR